MNERPVSPTPSEDSDRDRSLGFLSYATTRDPAESERRKRVGRYCQRRLSQIAEYLCAHADDLPSPQWERVRDQSYHYRFLASTINRSIYHASIDPTKSNPINLLSNRVYDFNLSEFKYLLPHLVRHWREQGHSVEDIETVFNNGIATIPIEEEGDFDYHKAEQSPLSTRVHPQEPSWAYDEFGERVILSPSPRRI